MKLSLNEFGELPYTFVYIARDFDENQTLYKELKTEIEHFA